LIWGVILAGVALGVAAIGGWPMTIAVVAMVALVGREWMTITLGSRPDAIGAAAVAALVIVVLAGADQIGLSLAASAAIAAGLGAWLRSGWATVGILYMAALGISAVALRADPFLGFEALLFVFAIVWVTDSAAYFAGRAIGGPKLWPAVSPGKTWAGAIGGATGGLVAGLLIGLIVGIAVTPELALVAFGLSALSQCGDLFESAVKRRFGVKDSGNLIPGHGGLMDRVDALIFALAAAAILGWLHSGWPFLGSGLLLW
jgi:phosphatidate cytidylyltransferase